MTPLEITSNLFNLLSVYLASRNSVLTWPTGIIGCTLFSLLFFQQKLYPDVCLQLFFIFTSISGWYYWNHGGKQKSELPITRVEPRKFLILCVLACASALGIGFTFQSWTDASYPLIDSHILSFSILAQLLLMRRKLESWLCWILVDSIAVPLYLVKGLSLTSGIYAVFLVNAVAGYFLWRRGFRRSIAA